MINTILLFISLFATWVIFSGFFEPFFLISGAISCLIAIYFARKMNVIDKDNKPLLLKASLPFYTLWLTKEIFVSCMNVAILMWRIDPKISPTLSWVRAGQKSEVGRVTYANSITLTPGTTCINIEGNMMQVHALEKDSIKDLEAGNMDKKVKGAIG